MRGWPDDHQTVPQLFRRDDDGFRMEFDTESEAAAFADTFAGHMISVLDTLPRWCSSPSMDTL
jgi:hypothetical protein